MLALVSSAALLSAADNFTGSWKLDVTNSTFARDNPAPRELTLTFTAEGADRTQGLKRTAADGRTTSTSWTAPVSGGNATFPVGQGPNGGASVRIADDNTLVMTQNHPYGKGASRTYQVSADGTALTLVQRSEDGQERARMTFKRQ
jgi:hypothetical protein